MAITNKESDEIFGALSERARTVGLGWVVEQVAEQIAHGKEEPVAESDVRKALRHSETAAQVHRAGKSSGEKLTRAAPFTPHERLRIMVRAMINAVVESFGVEKQLSEFAARHQRKEFLFESEEPEPRRIVAGSRDSLAAREPAIASLNKMLHELLEETNAP
jgi:hypothetical protein